jgi:hypothetical protein
VARHRAALDRIGVTSSGELADAIRAGAWDERGEQLRPVLAALVRDRLAVANPGHLALPIAAGDIP